MTADSGYTDTGLSADTTYRYTVDAVDGAGNVSLLSEVASVTTMLQDTPNTAPVISGSPPASVVANNSYSFQPIAEDADGDVMTFSISGKPDWADFNTTTGALTGIPSDGDVDTCRPSAFRSKPGLYRPAA